MFKKNRIHFANTIQLNRIDDFNRVTLPIKFNCVYTYFGGYSMFSNNRLKVCVVFPLVHHDFPLILWFLTSFYYHLEQIQILLKMFIVITFFFTPMKNKYRNVLPQFVVKCSLFNMRLYDLQIDANITATWNTR